MNLAPILVTLGGGLLALILAIYFWMSASRGGSADGAFANGPLICPPIRLHRDR